MATTDHSVRHFIIVSCKFNWGPFHTYPDIFESAQFRFGYGFPSRVTSKTSIRSRNFENSLPWVEIFEYATNPPPPSPPPYPEIVWMQKPDAKAGSSPVLYRECAVQEGILVARFSQGKVGCKFRALCDACSVNNIPRGVLGTRVNSDTCGRGKFHIFESGKKKLQIPKIAGYVHNIISLACVSSETQSATRSSPQGGNYLI